MSGLYLTAQEGIVGVCVGKTVAMNSQFTIWCEHIKMRE